MPNINLTNHTVVIDLAKSSGELMSQLRFHWFHNHQHNSDLTTAMYLWEEEVCITFVFEINLEFKQMLTNTHKKNFLFLG